MNKFIQKEKMDTKDWGWFATLYGTAVGAGILYMPITAAQAGLLPVIVIVIFSIPGLRLAHFNLSLFCMTASQDTHDITDTAIEKFGNILGTGVIFCYFACIFPILLLYGIGLTNTINDIMINFLSMTPPPRYIVSFFILAFMAIIMNLGEKWILHTAKSVVLPLALILMLCALYFIPVWQTPSFKVHSLKEFVQSAMVVIPLFMFSFNFSPACSAFAQSYRAQYGFNTPSLARVNRIVTVNTNTLFITIMPFVFSCIFAMTSSDVHNAIAGNIPALISISGAGYVPWMPYVISIITLLAIISSYLGVYIGANEGTVGILSLVKKIVTRKNSTNGKYANYIAQFITFICCWITATLNFNVISIIIQIVSPVMAFIVFVMPVCALYKLPELKKYRRPPLDLFVLFLGLSSISGAIYYYI